MPSTCTANSAIYTEEEQVFGAQEAMPITDAETSCINASTQGTNNQMTSTTPLHADHGTGSNIRMPTNEQLGQNTSDAATPPSL
jgi:hypothetical protein